MTWATRPNDLLVARTALLHNVPMAQGRGSFWIPMLLAAVVVYTLISITVAVSTANKCDDVSNGHKDWSLVPPKWECKQVIAPGN